jgi:hypothetical protein
VLTSAKTATMLGAAGLAALLTACGGSGSATATLQPATVAGPDPVSLRIAQVAVGGGVPIEGAFSYLRIDRADGGTVAEGRLPGRSRVMLRLPAGQYQLHSWQRICDGNCGHLDPPSARCLRTFTLHRGHPRRVTIQVRFPSSCEVVLGG